ncbi:MAG: hypothetical protein QNI86_10450 [Halieaceae bacterium]|nr:hypothetical protein [Halieaceae bacterium]
MEKTITVLLILVGLINFLPVAGVLSADRIASAYMVEVAGPDLEILLRHRALLFGALGGFILYAAFTPMLQWPAMILAAVSMIGFLVLVWSVGNSNTSLIVVAMVDLVGIVLLLATVTLKLLSG